MLLARLDPSPMKVGAEPCSLTPFNPRFEGAFDTNGPVSTKQVQILGGLGISRCNVMQVHGLGKRIVHRKSRKTPLPASIFSPRLPHYQILGTTKRLSIKGRKSPGEVRSPYSTRHLTSTKEGKTARMQQHSARAVIGLVARPHVVIQYERAAVVCSVFQGWLKLWCR
jgi:hypothetical protein